MLSPTISTEAALSLRSSAAVPAERFDVAMLAGGAIALAMTLPKTLQVVSTGIFLNPDDAMRAVEVRDFMAGQAWFDLVPHRLSPDHPFVMHWSRIVDLPLALLDRAFGLVLPPASAELAMRLAAPSLLFLVSLWAMLALVRNLLGARAMLPAGLLLGGAIEFVGNFIPGHIHHHAAQATLLLVATKLLLDALGVPGRWRAAAGTGLVAAISLGIGLQNLPFVAGLGAIAGLAWIVRGHAEAALLAGFGGGFALGGAVVFAIDVPPAAYGAGACDAFSTAHLLASSLGGGLCLVLAGMSARLRVLPSRLAAAGVTVLLLFAAIHAFYPACLHDPMAGVDPVLREKWLAFVGEALPLTSLIAADGWSGIPLALTLLGGLVATGAAFYTDRAQRPAWGALLLMAIVGFLGTLYQVRVAASTSAFLVPGIAWAALNTFDVVARKPQRPALLAATLVGLMGNGAVWSAIAVPAARMLAPAPGLGHKEHGDAGHVSDPASCWLPTAYEALKALPTGLVLSTIDPGSAILAATSQAVLAAPYHRNSYGNRVALLAFPATPDAARPLVAASRATIIALCPASNEVADLAAHHPDSLAAALVAGRIPDWLQPIGTGREPILLFAVKKP